MSGRTPAIPVVALTGHLGAGKTTVLNHLLSRPGSRVGVIVNDFGDINVDAGLVTGQVDEAASITGGCVCCLPDAGGLDDALDRLTAPRLRLDAVIIEASGVADPLALSRLIHFTGSERVRPGGVVEVVDAIEYEHAARTGRISASRVTAATLIVITKLDLLPTADRQAGIARLTGLIHRENPGVPIVVADRGRIDPSLVFDVTGSGDPSGQLSLTDLLREDIPHGNHTHAAAVTERARGAADAGAVVDLLENPPAGAYRLKGVVPVRVPGGERRYLVNLVGRSIHVATAPPKVAGHPDGLVAIGLDLDTDAARERLRKALDPADSVESRGLRRLQRHHRLSR